ncbi:O-antigen ligase family protein [Micromonospora sp. NPDC048839]|uniref:O-antigen ligase family protein n=1 Tax=Micromonospora sp. NPDC048839 TaxID=3155641 RepID=UPI003401BB3C
MTRASTEKVRAMGLSARILGAGLVVLAVAFLLLGRWDLALAVGVGALLGWVLLDADRITWAVFVVAFLVPVTINFGYPTNPSYSLLFLLFVLAAWGRVLRAERDGWRRKVIAAALFLPLCGLLSGLVQWHGVKPIAVGLAPIVCVGLLCWHVVEEARHDRDLIIRIALALTWLSVPIAAFAKYQTLTRSWPIFDQLAYHWTYTSAFDATRAVGVSGHPIVYGTFAMAMAIVALTLRGRFWYIPFTANLAGLVLSGTRSAWVGTALALGLWLLFQWRRYSWRGLGSGLVIAAAAFMIVAAKPPAVLFSDPAVPGAIWQPGSASPNSPGSGNTAPNSTASAPGSGSAVDVAGSRMADPLGSASADARFVRIRVVWDGITQDWSTLAFGSGPESNVRFLEDVGIGDGEAQVFDNTYLTFWYNYGLLGLISLLSLMVTLYWRLRSPIARVMLVGLSAQVFFFDLWLWLGAVAVLVLAVALSGVDNASRSEGPPVLPAPRGANRRSAAAQIAL